MVITGQGIQSIRRVRQAFSHWTWEASGNRLLICDLQVRAPACALRAWRRAPAAIAEGRTPWRPSGCTAALALEGLPNSEGRVSPFKLQVWSLRGRAGCCGSRQTRMESGEGSGRSRASKAAFRRRQRARAAAALSPSFSLSLSPLPWPPLSRPLYPLAQGVGDVWTDPQIHTIDGKGFGAAPSARIIAWRAHRDGCLARAPRWPGARAPRDCGPRACVRSGRDAARALPASRRDESF